MAVLLIILPLCGCFADQKAATQRCTATAKAQHARQVDQSEEEYIDSLNGPIAACRKAAGYTYYENQPDCDALYSNASCYTTKKIHYIRDAPEKAEQ